MRIVPPLLPLAGRAERVAWGVGRGRATFSAFPSCCPAGGRGGLPGGVPLSSFALSGGRRQKGMWGERPPWGVRPLTPLSGGERGRTMESGKACPSLCTPFYALLGGEKPTAGRPCSSALCQRAASGRERGWSLESDRGWRPSLCAPCPLPLEGDAVSFFYKRESPSLPSGWGQWGRELLDLHTLL